MSACSKGRGGNSGSCEFLTQRLGSLTAKKGIEMVEQTVANKFQAQRIHCFCSQECCTDTFFISSFVEILEIDDVQDRLEFFEHSLLFAHSSLPECRGKGEIWLHMNLTCSS